MINGRFVPRLVKHLTSSEKIDDDIRNALQTYLEGVQSAARAARGGSASEEEHRDNSDSSPTIDTSSLKALVIASDGN